MFRAELLKGDGAVVMKVQGQLSGECAEHVRALVTPDSTKLQLVVDLTDVTFIDAAGERVLCWFAARGAEFAADNVYSRYLCERLQLPLAGKSSAAAHKNRDNRKAQP